MARWFGMGLFAAAAAAAAAGGVDEAALEAALAAAHRAPENRARDVYRHPRETLRFFEVAPDMTVVEIWPGAKGYYTEILAPYLRERGRLYAAHFPADSEVAFYRDSRAAFLEKLAADPGVYDRVVVTGFLPPQHVDIAPPGSADRVLTFRNVHNWYMRGGGEARVIAAFRAFYRALKPGGILGVVEHRLPAERPASAQEGSGYMHQAAVVRMAEAAGFRLLAASEINANPRDSADHPKGVWTLPPTLRLGEQDRERYLAIGESDRMTLKFLKPASP
ncbi:MAG: methyltransferase [Gammaproteobacteria bacterium]|nr:MAG: methyltransferase [Gammaproteobacteria bacterium]